MNLTQMGIAAITFDLDDTLWPCAPVISAAEQVYYQWFVDKYPRIAEAHSVETLRDMRRELLEAQPELVNDVTEWRLRATRALLLRYDAPVEHAANAFDVFIKARQKVEFYPEVLNGLQDLSFHYRLGSLTNGNADLQAIGVSHLFDTALYATLELPAKPAPDMFLRAAEALGVEPGRILHVGDNAHTDITGARDAGCSTAWIRRGTETYPDNLPRADLEITSLDDLIALAPTVPRR